MGQDDNEQYAGLALALASDQYMEHSSKDVRLLVACCIADVFRIFAPEAPYKEQEQLKVRDLTLKLCIFYILSAQPLCR